MARSMNPFHMVAVGYGCIYLYACLQTALSAFSSDDHACRQTLCGGVEGQDRGIW